MRRARLTGNFIEKCIKEQSKEHKQMAELLNIPEVQFKNVLKGQKLLTFAQMERLSEELQVSVENLIQGDSVHYEKTAVHCMEEFKDTENREIILDIIDHYVSIRDATL